MCFCLPCNNQDDGLSLGKESSMASVADSEGVTYILGKVKAVE